MFFNLKIVLIFCFFNEILLSKEEYLFNSMDIKNITYIQDIFHSYITYGLSVDKGNQYSSYIVNLTRKKIDSNFKTYYLLEKNVLSNIHFCDSIATPNVHHLCTYFSDILYMENEIISRIYFLPKIKENFMQIVSLCHINYCETIERFHDIIGYNKFFEAASQDYRLIDLGNFKSSKYIPNVSFFQLFGPVGKYDLLLHYSYLDDHWTTVPFFKAFQLHSGTTCDCNPQIVKKIVICEQLIVGLSEKGVSFLIKYEDYILKVNAENTLNSKFKDKCIINIDMNFEYNYYNLVYYGGCQDKDLVWYSYLEIPAPVFKVPEIKLQLYISPNTLVNPCTQFPASITCKIINSLIYKNEDFKNIFLITYQLRDSSIYYAVLMIIESDLLVIKNFKNKLIIPSKIQDIDSDEGSGFTEIIINGMKHYNIGDYVYFYGSHLFYLLEETKNLYIMPKFFNGTIEFFDILMSGYVLFGTDESEIWVGRYASNTFKFIFPSFVANYILKGDYSKGTFKNIKSIKVNFYKMDNYLVVLEMLDKSLKVIDLPISEIFNYVENLNSDEDSKGGEVFSNYFGCMYSKITIFIHNYYLFENLVKSFPKYLFPIIMQKENIFYTLEDIYYMSSLYDVFYSHINRPNMQLSDFRYITNDIYNESPFYTSEFGSYLSLNGLLKDKEVYLNEEDFKPLDTSPHYSDFQLPEKIFIFSGDVNIYFYAVIIDSNISNLYIENIFIDVECDHGLIDYKVNKEVYFYNLTVILKLTIFKKHNLKIALRPPGKDFIATYLRITFSESHAFCFSGYGDWNFQKGLYHSTILIGCPSPMLVSFNAEASLILSSKFEPYRCQDDQNHMCFDASYTFRPVFDLVSRTSMKLELYKGNYTLRVIGYKERNDHVTHLFNEQQILDYNNAKFGDAGSRLMYPKNISSYDEITGWPLYSQQTPDSSSITWMCLGNSPCSCVWSTFQDEVTDIYLLMEFSNAIVPDYSTLCNHTIYFWIRLYNLPFSPVYQLIPIIIMSTAVIFHIMYMIFLYLGGYYL